VLDPDKVFLVGHRAIIASSARRLLVGLGATVREVIETDEHRLFRKTLRDLLEREIEPHVEEWERNKSFPAHELFPRLAAVGLLGLEYDEAYGGMGADHSFTVVAGEELGRVSCGGVPMAIAVQMSMATPALHRYGSPELKQRFLLPAVRGEMVASIAVTEPDAGSDVAGIRTRAERDGDEWLINGSKLYITNGTQADWLCLLARTSPEGGHRGMSLIVVPTATPGVRVSRTLEKLGMWSSDTAELAFDDVRVPVANTIGETGRGFQQQMVQFQAERLITLYRQIGSIDQSLSLTRDYLAERRAFGQPLLANQHIQFTLAELRARHDMLRHYGYAAADAVSRGEDATRFATVGKLLGSRLQREVADACLQFHGGIGYMAEHWTSRYFRDTRLDSIGAGADEVMLRILARMDGFDSGSPPD
jgi:citronellyl-CoA dehydrogenase